jgi:hypothetical protein
MSNDEIELVAIRCIHLSDFAGKLLRLLARTPELLAQLCSRLPLSRNFASSGALIGRMSRHGISVL